MLPSSVAAGYIKHDMHGRHTLAFALAGTLALTMGCAGRNRPATRPATAPTLATDIAPETATATYWLEQPPVVSVHSSNYADLMAECDHVLRQRFFLIDRSRLSIRAPGV